MVLTKGFAMIEFPCLDALALAVYAVTVDFDHNQGNLSKLQLNGARPVCIIWDYEPRSNYPVCADVTNADPKYFLYTP
jgi:hypothetical protein